MNKQEMDRLWDAIGNKRVTGMRPGNDDDTVILLFDDGTRVTLKSETYGDQYEIHGASLIAYIELNEGGYGLLSRQGWQNPADPSSSSHDS